MSRILQSVMSVNKSIITFFYFLISVFLFTSCLDDDPGTASTIVSIQYDGSLAYVTNSLEKFGVKVTVSGADVVVNSTYAAENIQFRLSGSADDGSFKIYSSNAFNLKLDGLTLTNADGPALNVQGKKGTYVILADGTVNTLTDGPVYDAEVLVDGLAEEQSAAFFSEGQLVFNGTGSLIIHGNGSVQHALASDDYIQVDSVNLTIASSAKDGIHCNDGYIQKGGSVDVSVHGDGIDAGTAYVDISGGDLSISCDSAASDGICCDSVLTISGGNVSLVVTGNQSKGLKSEQTITLSGGNIDIVATGGVVLSPLNSGNDVSYSTGIKSATNVLLDGSAVSILHSGIAGKGISVGTDFTMNSGSLTINTSGGGGLYTNSLGYADAYSAACISSNGTVNILGGKLEGRSTGAGGKGISSDGILTIGSADSTLPLDSADSSPDVFLRTSGAAVKSGSTSMTEPKVLKSDQNIYLVGGTIALDAAGYGEAIDTKASLYMSGGKVVVQGPVAGSQVRTIDYETLFNITGGTLMACGPYRSSIPVPTPISSTQNYVYATLNSAGYTLPANTLFNIQDAGGNSLVTFMPFRNAYFFLYSSSSLIKNTTYSIYTGGTYAEGTETNGMYLGGTYASGTKKVSFTPISIKTSTTFTN
jgi:trimeric autotransporter adhesin